LASKLAGAEPPKAERFDGVSANRREVGVAA
jgi:hypothetical protein